MLFFICFSSSVHSAYFLKSGKLIHEKYVSTMSLQEHFEAGIDAIKKGQWHVAQKQFLILTHSFAQDDLPENVDYYLALSYYQLEDYDFANRYFSSYLQGVDHRQYFEEALNYKFMIAVKFSQGAKKHFLGLESMPKWFSSREDAISLYGEIIAVLPYHEIAAKAFLGKAEILKDLGRFKESHETYQMFLQRFPNHELAPQAYLSLATLYLRQCKSQERNPDLIELARINLRKFKKKFPSYVNFAEVEEKLMEMAEIYAKELCAIGQLYERKKKPKASIIYYSNTILEYPNTVAASFAKQRLRALKSWVLQMNFARDILE